MLFSIAIFLVFLGASRPLHAQSEEDQEIETRIDISPETPEFKEAFSQFRKHLGEMNRVIVRYSVGDDAEDKKWREQWLELVAEGNLLHQHMVEAALAEYKLDPAGRPELAEMLFRILKRNCEADRYEGMLDVAKTLVDNDYPDPMVINYAGQSAFAANDFETARPYFEKLIQGGNTTDLLRDTSRKLSEYQQLWNEELSLREEDAQGEPLPRVLIKTSKGDIEVELFENQAPETVANFIYLAESGFYDNLDFHRVIEHFMAQTGCPNEDGTGGPGYTIASEVEKPNARKFFRGTLGLALGISAQTGQEDRTTGGSQFFITFLPTHQLNGRYTAFGRVVKGFDVLANLQRVDPDNKDEKEGEPKAVPDEIIRIEVLHKREHDYAPNKL